MKRRRQRRAGPVWDAIGDTGDGGLVIVGKDDVPIHRAPPAVTAAVRYFITRVQRQDAGLAARVALTSALRGEGVTFLTRSLGAVLAYDFPHEIAVVDLNWWAPSRFGSEANDQPGVADVVDGGTNLDDVIVPTTNPRLSLLPAGAVPMARRTALARSDELADVLDELEGRYRHLIFDLPAVGATSDAIGLCRLADSFALVVHQGVTPDHQVQAALDDLRDSDALGVILNRFSTRVPRRLRRMLGV